VVGRRDQRRVLTDEPDIFEPGKPQLLVHVVPPRREWEERVVVDVFAQDGRDRLVALVVRAGLDHVDDGPVLLFVLFRALCSRHPGN